MDEKGFQENFRAFQKLRQHKIETVAKYFINEVAWYFEMEMLLYRYWLDIKDLSTFQGNIFSKATKEDIRNISMVSFMLNLIRYLPPGYKPAF